MPVHRLHGLVRTYKIPSGQKAIPSLPAAIECTTCHLTLTAGPIINNSIIEPGTSDLLLLETASSPYTAKVSWTTESTDLLFVSPESLEYTVKPPAAKVPIESGELLLSAMDTDRRAVIHPPTSTPELQFVATPDMERIELPPDPTPAYWTDAGVTYVVNLPTEDVTGPDQQGFVLPAGDYLIQLDTDGLLP